MLKYNIELEKLKSLNGLISSKNEMSVLNGIDSKELSEVEKEELASEKILDSEGKISKDVQTSIDILANPYGVVKYTFTGGVGVYEQSLSFDDTFSKHVQMILTNEYAEIDDNANINDIIEVMEDFVGKSNIKSLNISYKLNNTEALVIAAMLDMERKAILRAFVDESVYAHNSYNVNVIWRMVNSTNPSIQWFVYLINEVIGKHDTLTQNQVQEAIKNLIDKGIIVAKGSQYVLSEEFLILSNRMIVIDDVISVQTYKQENDGVINSGFTCIQAGVHDLLLLDYDGNEISFETITSTRLIEYMEQISDSEKYFNNIKA